MLKHGSSGKHAPVDDKKPADPNAPPAKDPHPLLQKHSDNPNDPHGLTKK